MHFYSEEFLNTPEFRYENKLDVIKAKDRDNLIEYLEMKEKQEEDDRLAREAAALDANATPNKGKDAKKEVKKPPPGKGAAVAEDKNSP